MTIVGVAMERWRVTVLIWPSLLTTPIRSDVFMNIQMYTNIHSTSAFVSDDDSVTKDQGGYGDAGDGETGEGNGGESEDDDDDDDDAEGGEARHVRVNPEGPSARPRRLSELNTPNKIRPIPPSNSMFVFAPTNG